MRSPLDIFTEAAKSAPAPRTGRIYVDDANFAKLCEHHGARRYILDGIPYVDLLGVTYRHVVAPSPEDVDGGDL